MARKDQLEQAADEARAVLAERRVFLDSADIIANFAADMSEFLRTSDITESKAFMRSFVGVDELPSFISDNSTGHIRHHVMQYRLRLLYLAGPYLPEVFQTKFIG